MTPEEIAAAATAAALAAAESETSGSSSAAETTLAAVQTGAAIQAEAQRTAEAAASAQSFQAEMAVSDLRAEMHSFQATVTTALDDLRQQVSAVGTVAAIAAVEVAELNEDDILEDANAPSTAEEVIVDETPALIDQAQPKRQTPWLIRALLNQ